MPKRIAIAAEFYPPDMGGMEEAAQRLARVIMGLGFEVEVVTVALQGPPGSHTKAEPDGSTVTRVGPQPDEPYRRSIAQALLERGPFDAVMGMQLTSYAADVVRTARRWGVPSIVCARGRDVHLDLFDMPHASFIMEAVSGATVVTAVSREMQRMLGPYRPDGRVVYWPNTVDMDHYRPHPRGPEVRAQRGLPAEGLLVGFFGHLRAVKGMHELLAAFSSVFRQRPDAHLAIIGGLRGREVQEAVQAWQRRDPAAGARLLLLPYFPQAELPPLLACLDQTWLPSHFEGFSNGLLQAMACEVPVVATPVGGHVDLLADGVNALLVPPRDAEALAWASLRLATDPEFARHLAARARASLTEHYHPEAEVARLRDLFTELGLLAAGVGA